MPNTLRVGINVLSSVSGCFVLSEPQYDPSVSAWLLPIELEIKGASDFVAKRTAWIIHISNAYPLGIVNFFPASESGLTTTFPHQERNTEYVPKRSWRSGKLCLDSPFRWARLVQENREPLGEAELRLAWHAERALDWLTAAVRGDLLAPGDPFEIPKTPTSIEAAPGRRLVHDESTLSYPLWEGRGGLGFAQFAELEGISSSLIIESYSDLAKSVVRNWGDGRPVRQNVSSELVGFWWLWPGTIALPPWESPSTWGELRKIGQMLHVEVDRILRDIARRVRGKSAPAVLLLGYPIAQRVGDSPCEIHWDALLLPKLSANGEPPRGFRPNERGWWMRDRRTDLSDNSGLKYVTIENWHEDRLQARGRLEKSVRERSALVLGTGALGSVVAELFARMGLQKMTLLDGDDLVAGNVVRHILTLNDIHRNKAESLRARLLQISPHLDVTALTSGMPLDQKSIHDLIDPFDIVIDCSASDDVLSSLELPWWSVPKQFVSLSLGFRAKRLFAFNYFGNSFPNDAFRTAIAPWLEDEAEAWHQEGETLEGAGCWSPLMPARYDDIVAAAALGVKFLERNIEAKPFEPRLAVFEQQLNEMGVSLVCRTTDAISG